VINAKGQTLGGISAQLSDATKKLGSWIDVTEKPYNAKGDGVTDDTAAFALAITAMGSGYCNLLIPPGTYRVKLNAVPVLSFRNMNHFSVYGYGAQIITDALLVNDTTPNTRLIRFQNCSNFAVRGIHFKYQVDWTSALSVGKVRDEQLLQVWADTGELCENITISENTFEYSGPQLDDPNNGVTNRLSILAMASQTSQGVYIHNVRNFTIHDNQFVNCLGRTIYTLLCDTGTISGNTFKELGQYVKPDLSQQQYAEAVGIRLLASKNIAATGNTINCYSGDIVNLIDRGSIHAIVTASGDLPGMQAENITITGNTVNMHKCGAWFYGVGASDNVLFADNLVTCEDLSADSSYGVRCDQVQVKNVTIARNTFKNISTFYFLDTGVDTDYSNIVIENNTHIWGNNSVTGYSSNTKKRSYININFWTDKKAQCQGPERQRIIYSKDTPPTGGASGDYLGGDICWNTDFDMQSHPVQCWVYQFWDGTKHRWKPCINPVHKGVTGSRPVIPAGFEVQFQGIMYLDTTLSTNGKLIIYDGNSHWLDATGATV
jgi:hypothetical protein